MGQQFRIVNLDKKEAFSPCDCGSGNKLAEMQLSRLMGPLLVDLLTYHGVTASPEDLSISGRWAGDRVIIVGDQWFDMDGLYEQSFSYRDIGPLVKQWVEGECADGSFWTRPDADADLGRTVRAMGCGDSLHHWAKNNWHYMKDNGTLTDDEYIGETPEAALSMTQPAEGAR